MVFLNLFLAFAFAADPEPLRLSKDRPIHKNQLPYLSIPVQEGASSQYYRAYLNSSQVDTGELSLAFKEFKPAGTIELKAGSVLKIDTFMISDHLVAASRSMTWKTDFPSIEELRDQLNSDDPNILWAALIKLSEERRHAQDSEEFKKYLKGNILNHDLSTQANINAARRNIDAAKKRGIFNDYLFPTDFIEVHNVAPAGQDPDVRYFLALTDLKKRVGKIKLDVRGAKIQVLQSLALLSYRELAKEHRDPRLEKVAKSLEHICDPGSCAFSKERNLGHVMMDMTRIFNFGMGDKDDKGIDPARRSYCQQLCVLHEVHQTCPGLKDLEEIELLVAKEKLDCDSVESRASLEVCSSKRP